MPCPYLPQLLPSLPTRLLSAVLLGLLISFSLPPFTAAQGYALFKHMSVADNITFGPRMRNMNIDLESR